MDLGTDMDYCACWRNLHMLLFNVSGYDIYSTMTKNKKISVQKTFQKGADISDVLDFIMHNEHIETNDYIPEGSNGGCEPYPNDPVSELKYKYIIQITKVL